MTELEMLDVQITIAMILYHKKKKRFRRASMEKDEQGRKCAYIDCLHARSELFALKKRKEALTGGQTY